MERELVRTTASLRALRRYLKRHPETASDLEATLETLAEDAFDPILKTHKLKGHLDGVWACSAGFDLRILFEFAQYDGKEAVLLLSIGTHDEVY